MKPVTKKQILTKKQRALEVFTQRLFKVREGVFIDRIVVHGSFVRGQADRESDIDVMVFARKPKEVEKKVEDIAFDIMLSQGEYIEPFVYPTKEFNKPSSYFIYQAIKSGKEMTPYEAGRR